METPELRDDPGEGSSSAEPGPSESTSRTVTASVSRRSTADDAVTEDFGRSKDTMRPHLKGIPFKPPRLHHESSQSKLVYIEPPPVVRRPPKIKNDSFSIRSFLFSWDRTERRDGLYCARSTHKMYSYTSNVRILGMSFGRTVAVEFSTEGIESAVETRRFGKKSWSQDRLDEARHRLSKYTHDQRKQIEAAAAQRDSARLEPVQEKDLTDLEGQNESAQTLTDDSPNPGHQHPYVVVGFMGDESVPKETLRRILEPEHLFKELHKAHRHIRGFHRRIMSLKECSGFGIYECDPTKGYHREVELDRETERALAEMWRSYRGHKLDYEGRWLSWIHHNFNNGSNNPEEGHLTLEFKLKWSIAKVVTWGIVPVLLSLAIGFYYMYGADHGDEADKVAIAEAAWVIATYITTTSALLFALLAVITQFGAV